MSDQLRLEDHAAVDRYEAVLDGTVVGSAAYEREGSRIVFTHTVVAAAAEGQGIGSRLARFALDDARAQGLTVDPQCPFIASWIERHPDYADLVG